MGGTSWHKWRAITMLILGMSAILHPATSSPASAVANTVSRSASPEPDAATTWHNIAVQMLVTATPARPTPIPFVDMAVVQIAVHDAVQAIERRFNPYHVTFPRGTSGSPEAAAAKAAHDVLVAIVPGQAAALAAHYRLYFASHSLAENDPGVAIGASAAAGILALRANDGRVPNPLPPPYTGGTAPGQWRPTPSLLPGAPPSLAPMASPWLGSVPPFTLRSAEQFRADPPPALTSAQYTRDFYEVKALGALTGSSRTPEQTQLATFFGGNLLIMYHQTLRDVAAWQTDSIGDNARLLALGSLAIADAVIGAWDSKLKYPFWRPITGIREGENDGNPETQGDPSWQPFINTPNYPETASGANNIAAALTGILELYFGTDQMSFTVVSTNPNAAPNRRTYTRLSDLCRDTINVRIYQGVHFRTTDEASERQGKQVAAWVFGHVLRPINE